MLSKFKQLLGVLFFTCSPLLQARTLPIIPLPQKSEITGGAFELSGRSLSVYVDKRFCPRATSSLITWFKQNYPFGTRNGKKGKADFEVVKNDSIAPEGYRLMGNGHIRIEASHAAGVFYALQSLSQLAQKDPTTRGIKFQESFRIEDAPRFSWRGFMLDEGRHFFGKQEVKRILDIMARYKMNRFHWHLTEDQGWRIQIKKYPLLTDVGAWRTSKTLPWGGVKADNTYYGGFYTQKDIKEIVAYARQRFIEIVPEIDMPGHFQAAIAAYPKLLACDPEQPHQVWVGQGVSTDVMNVALPSAVKFTKDVLNELISLFPFEYIHLGGDECPTTKWQQTPACQELLKKIGSANYRDLQTHFYVDINNYLHQLPKNKRRKLIFWNEVLYGNTSQLKDITIMAWVGAEHAALEAAKRGFNTILSPQIPYYINRKQSSHPKEPLSQGQGTENLRCIYGYSPTANVPTNLLPYYLGVQANFWTEWVANNGILEYLLLPRLAAVAEAGWTPQNERHYDNFLKRIKSERNYYREKGYEFGQEAFGKPGRWISK